MRVRLWLRYDQATGPDSITVQCHRPALKNRRRGRGCRNNRGSGPFCGRIEIEERQMATKYFAFVCCTLLALGGAAQAGPCNTTAMKDAGSGPTPGHTGQTTTGSATVGEHPPTSAMNKAVAGGAASPQDVQKQTMGQPTAAQRAEGAKPSRAEDDGC